MTLKSKICGVSTLEVLDYLINHPFAPELIGFIVNYPKSNRYIEPSKLKNLLNTDKKKSKFVAVLVEPKPNQGILEEIKEFIQNYN